MNNSFAILAFLATLFAMPTADAQSNRITKLRGGTLSVAGPKYEMKVMFNGKTVRNTEDNSFGFHLQKTFRIHKSDVVLIQYVMGGTACPAMFFFATVTTAGKLSLSEDFGTCSDLVETKLVGEEIFVSLPNMYERGNSTFKYTNGKVR